MFLAELGFVVDAVDISDAAIAIVSTASRRGSSITRVPLEVGRLRDLHADGR